MPYSKNHTEKTFEEDLESISKQVLTIGARAKERFDDLVETYNLAGGTTDGLAALLNNTDAASLTQDQKDFAADAFATGQALSAIVTAIENNAAALRRFS